jgi:predicted dehydrogenase
LIGVGRRGQGNFLPALHCLRPHFAVAWIHARTPERLREISHLWDVPAAVDLDDETLTNADVVAVTVPIEQNLHVLRKLQRHASRLILVIDTPIAQSILDARACRSLLAEFKTVLVAEDYMNFPEFELARRAAATGVIGRIADIELRGLGYRYHGLALLRSFAGFAPVRSSVRHSGPDSSTILYRFGQGMSACVIGPYRRDQGSMCITGTRGVLRMGHSGKPRGAPESAPVHDLRIERTGEGAPSMVVLESRIGRQSIALSELATMAELPFSDKSDLNLRRSWGLMQVFKALHEDNLNRRYGFRNALYDAIMSRASEKLPLLFDPLTYAGGHLLKLVA